MNRSYSEICFQKFLEGDEGSPLSGELDLSTECNGAGDHVVEIEASLLSDQPPTTDVDPGEYAVVLKRKLDMYCAAVAKSRGSKEAPLMGLQPSANGYVASGGLSQLTTQNSGVGNKSATSCSSKEISDMNEEDQEGENDMNEDMDPANAKRMRRMLSNRESARRSRRRKQAHMNDIETEVLQLRVENSSLLRRLTDMTERYNETSVDNRVLKADIETLRAKVKMAEDRVKGVTGLDEELYRSISDMSEMTIPFSLRPHDEISDMAAPAEGVANYFPECTNEFMCPPNIDRTGMLIDRTNRKIGRSRYLKRVASLECLQKRLCAGSSLCDPNQCDTAMQDGNKAPDKQS